MRRSSHRRVDWSSWHWVEGALGSHTATPFTAPPATAPTTLHFPAGSLMTLRGAGAYDAAVHCACVSAEKRQGQARAPASTCLSPACPRLLQGGDAEQLRGSELPAQRDGDSVPEGAPRGGQVGVTSEREASCMEGAWVADKGACSEGEEGADEPDDLSEVDPASLVKVEAATLLELANAAIAGSDTEADGSASSAGALGWGADDENAEAVRVPMSGARQGGGGVVYSTRDIVPCSELNWCPLRPQTSGSWGGRGSWRRGMRRGSRGAGGWGGGSGDWQATVAQSCRGWSHEMCRSRNARPSLCMCRDTLLDIWHPPL